MAGGNGFDLCTRANNTGLMPRRGLVAMICVSAAAAISDQSLAQSVTLGGLTFSQKGLVGVGRIDADKHDKQNETFGSLSGIAVDVRTWQRNTSGSYTSTLYTQPD